MGNAQAEKVRCLMTSSVIAALSMPLRNTPRCSVSGVRTVLMSVGSPASASAAMLKQIAIVPEPDSSQRMIASADRTPHQRSKGPRCHRATRLANDARKTSSGPNPT